MREGNEMGIEEDAVGLFIGFIVLILSAYLIAGLILLRNKSKRIGMQLVGSSISMALAFFFLFNCYFRFEVVDSVSNMTFGIGLFLIAWSISIYFTVSLFALLIKDKK